MERHQPSHQLQARKLIGNERIQKLRHKALFSDTMLKAEKSMAVARAILNKVN